jgi:5-methylcytosine-specific restriction enzyme A
MAFDMEKLIIGNSYTRDTLAEKWGYKSRQAISRGIVTPANEDKIMLFVTKIKQKSDTQYNDYFIEKDLLHIEGETSHFNDNRLINAEVNNDSIYLFYRSIHHTPFVYYGEVYLADWKIFKEKPSIFIFSPIKSLALSAGINSTEQQKTGSNEGFIADPEGEKISKTHVTYERSIKNRAKAIEIHGTVCKVCGFDFDKFYGAELAKHYIEIHHIIPLSELNKTTNINISTDLIPLCSNCHSMIHRRREALSVEELKNRIRLVKNNNN